eukprot:gene13798-biopygen8679
MTCGGEDNELYIFTRCRHIATSTPLKTRVRQPQFVRTCRAARGRHSGRPGRRGGAVALACARESAYEAGRPPRGARCRHATPRTAVRRGAQCPSEAPLEQHRRMRGPR